MIHTKLSIHCKILVFFFFLSSCTTVNIPIANLNKVSPGAMNQLTNDSLGLKIDFYGNANFGSKYLDLKDVRSIFRKRKIKFPSKNIVFWGTYDVTRNPMYFVGSLETSLDVSKFTADTSMYKCVYYRSIQKNRDNIISRVAIPYHRDSFLLVSEVRTEITDMQESVKDVLNGIKTSYNSLAYGEKFVEQKPVQEPDYYNIAESIFKDNGYANYLSTRDTLEKLVLQNEDSQFANELLKSYRSFLGESVQYDNETKQEQQSVEKTAITIDQLVEKIKEHRVVMFNENHLQPRCRLLINLLLPKLYKEGFNVLALEGLSEDDDRINKLGFPNVESGFYTRDPNMANLIRTARIYGLKVIGYEDFENTINRDLQQAKNLIRKSEIVTKNQVKLIVLAGGGHIEEGDIGEIKSMAQYFKKLSKIDPYTINQVKFLSINDVNDLVYVIESKILNGYDLYLSNNLNSDKIVIGAKDLNRSYSIPNTDSTKSGTSAIYIYHEKEYQLDKTAIPVYLSLSKKDSLQVDLPKGVYRYVKRDHYGAIIHQETIAVE
ncbi:MULTISPECIES: hypothetical protein [Sphingobacterium]|uniref:hypothetical protein n=1 Tax=Sphingobacterium TaxID=28453 RepID=UPI00257B50A6|nr:MULTISPECIES: hypothetical protein [Sphingobacterium]